MKTALARWLSTPVPGQDANRTWICLVAGLCSIALTSATVAGANTSGVSITHAWVRFVISTRPAAGYFEIDNSTDAAIELIGASSTGCGELTLHQSRKLNGVETMVPIERVEVPAHGSVTFAPGGYHLMCISPAATLLPGKSVPITLKFRDGKTIPADFEVRGASNK